MKSEIPEWEQPDLRWEGAGEYILRNDFEWYDEQKVVTLHVPAGFKSDGASVPVNLHWVCDPEDLSEAAWLIHDYLYRYQGAPPNLATWARYTRAQVDALFDSINKRHGVPSRKCRLAYLGVRLGGWTAWRKNRKAAK